MAESSVERRSNSHLPFPPEIRNEIYRHVFIPKYKGCRGGDYGREHWIMADMALLRVSKTTNQEATGLLYTEKAFRVCISGLQAASSIPPVATTLDLITNLTVDASTFCPYPTPAVRKGVETLCFGKAKLGVNLHVICNDFVLREEYGRTARKAFIEMLENSRGFLTITLDLISWPPRDAEPNKEGYEEMRNN